MTDNHEAILAKLDTVIAIMQLAFRDQIDVARKQILADPISAALLERTSSGWVDAGELRASVARDTKQSERTIQRRIAGLLAQRAMEQGGAGPKTRYRATGLI